jgi:hypothetical protein
MNQLTMKRLTVGIVAVSLTGVLGLSVAVAQSAPKTLASTMSVYVFPKTGQDAKQQSIDEAECYNWAVQNVGTDPFEQSAKLQEAEAQAGQQKQQAKDASKGAGAKGAVGGAAAGALIGEIASDDPGGGAAIGAAAGLIRGRRKAKRGQQQASQQADQQVQQAQQATGEQITNFKKAFSVCLEAKDYMVKY